ncbi:MAG TPA: shikimate dehydrogenase [Streptosporangiaceae bacterium]|nr:shikimate dehydrogenase [Streptosporangiaceae bacterium]
MRAAVLGKPIAHSLSPVLHLAAYRALGIADEWTYEIVECDERELPEVLDRGWAGLSLTMPLKRAVLPLLDRAEPLAVEVGGANTVVFREDGRYGYNTDVAGMIAALAGIGVVKADSATILGAGATACAALAAVRGLGLTEVMVLVRDRARAGDLLAAARRLGMDVDLRPLTTQIRNGDLLISTLPAGAADFISERPLVSRSLPVAVLDVVYAPWPTRLALAAERAGVPVASGGDLLLHQAARQVELMTGRSPAPVADMRAALAARLPGPPGI